MQQHNDHAGLQEICCGALRILAANNDQNKATIAAKGGIDVIVEAMHRHGDNLWMLYDLNFTLTKVTPPNSFFDKVIILR
jgi:hypothetical protein